MACKIKMNLPKQEDGLVGWGGNAAAWAAPPWARGFRVSTQSGPQPAPIADTLG